MSDRDVTVAPDDYTAKLMDELVQVLDERDTLRAKLEVTQSMRHAEHERHTKENARLRELVERLFGRLLELLDENARLRELVRDMWHEGAFEPGAYCVKEADELEERTRELGIEVDE